MNPITDFAILRAALADRPAGAEGWDYVDDAIDVLAEDIRELYPNAPADAALAYATAAVRKAMEMGPPGDDSSGGGRGPRSPSPLPAPEALVA